MKLELEILETISVHSKEDPDINLSSPTSTYSPAAKTNNNTKYNPYQALDSFYSYKLDHVAKKTADSLYAQCKCILDIVGKTSLRKIRRADAEGVKKSLQHYPRNLKKIPEFKNLCVKEAIKLNKTLEKPTLSEESIKDYIHKCSSFFEWCVLNELTDINPFKGIRFKKTKRDNEGKFSYSTDEQKLIFSDPIFTKHQYIHSHYFWLPILAKLTGARLNELCQLYITDIVKVDSIWCISISDDQPDQKLKNLQSKRLIPIHSFILDMGFIDYIHALQSKRLFPELKAGRDGYGSAPSKWFGRFKTKLGFDKKHDFHSFRHTVATELKNSLISSEVAASILGHLLNNITYDRYGKGYELTILKEAIERIPTDALSKIKPFT
ncbi:hypothetical protein VSU01S_09830 [Vibrio superstes NBRC 103154]|uniref:Tyr recombinase domain-containing protein n=1 Tax=Vibrio superstes NBRC 103154 TaxID=1219062 RepID=A0A511QN31_9VIBR|nr:site-specific integrase [Vibrio superstes]GEM78738.1 hypothetical protein VSU01S_09830 [Vibrio superstes NBRC 103154]